MLNIHLFLEVNIPQQPARFSLRSRMVGSLAPQLYALPSTLSASSLGVLGIFISSIESIKILILLILIQ